MIATLKSVYKHIFFLSVCINLFFVFPLYAQNKQEKQDSVGKEDYYENEYFRYDNYVYKSNIKTVLLHKDGWDLSPALIELNTDEQLLLSFDDLDADHKNYQFTFIHCNADWKPSDLLQSEYLTGFYDDNINTYLYSVNTLQSYTHYSVVFPTENMQPIKSGNYLLKVFLENNKDEVILTRKFSIAEKLISIDATVKPATSVNDRFSKQEVDFTIVYGKYKIDNPYENLKIILTQNNRSDNQICNLKPKFIRGNELIYDYEEGNTFAGGSEFRYFDTKSLKTNSDRIAKMEYDTLKNVITLIPDQKRTYKVYNSDRDINGKFLIKNQHGLNSATDADYAWVSFYLYYDEPIAEGNLYVFGALTDWQFQKNAMMKYDKKYKAYFTSLYLKQGYYNYEYIFLKDGNKSGDETFVEGSHFETENDYIIYAYYREIGSNYDRLIGINNFNSFSKSK